MKTRAKVSFARHSWTIAVALCFFADCPAQAITLQWDGAAWVAGSKSNSYDITGDGTPDITVAVSGSNNTFTNDTTSGDMTPAVNQSITGGISPAVSSLMIAGNLHTQSNVTLQISFTGQYPGANNVSFSIFDIDLGTNSDRIDGIYGVAPDGTHIAATITDVGSAITQSGTGLNQLLNGTAASPNSGPGSSNGNATISFGSSIITDVFFTFSNTAGAPRYQDIAVGDISFTPVPEVNPAVMGGATCALGACFAIRQRGRRNQAAA